jgi:hypothetical protein
MGTPAPRIDQRRTKTLPALGALQWQFSRSSIMMAASVICTDCAGRRLDQFSLPPTCPIQIHPFHPRSSVFSGLIHQQTVST